MTDNNPAIRFAGFNNPWERRKVGELCSISTGKSNTQDKIDDGIYPFYVRSPIIEKSNKYLYDEEAVITVGDGVGTGKVFHYVNGKYDLHQRCYRMYDFSDELDARYFYHTFSLLFYKRVMAMTAKTSVDSVRLEMISDMEIPTPCIEEQRAISQYLTNLDHLITLHQRKYERLLNVKKSMLEKMFPPRLPDGQENGSNLPEIRFAGFNDSLPAGRAGWEQRKLGEVTQITMGQSPDGTTYSETPSDYILVQGNADLKDGWVSPRIWTTQKTKSADAGDLIMSVRAPAGTMGKTEYDVVLGRGVAGIKGNEFIFQTLVKMDSDGYWKKLAAGSTFESINSDAINNAVISIPQDIDEQRRIGDYFRNLDHLITLHQRKCEKLKQIKKSMLEKMFV